MNKHELVVRIWVLLSASTVITGCATRPTTKDVTGYKIFHIAQAVRCELRDAALNIYADAVGDLQPNLARFSRGLSLRDFQSDDSAEKEALRIDSSFKIISSSIQNGTAGEDDHAKIAAILRYLGGSLAYDFDLNMRKTDDVGAGVDLLSTFTGGTVKLSPGVSVKGKREATRTFRVIDKFGELLTNLPTIRECNDLRRNSPSLGSPNRLYPIAGSLGLGDLLREFISFNQSANLVGPKDKEKIATMTEAIEFTTTLTAGVEPKLTLVPLGRSLEVTGAPFTLKTERYDRHKVTLTFTLPERQVKDAVARSEAEIAAIEALDEQRKRSNDDNAREILNILLLQ